MYCFIFFWIHFFLSLNAYDAMAILASSSLIFELIMRLMRVRVRFTDSLARLCVDYAHTAARCSVFDPFRRLTHRYKCGHSCFPMLVMYSSSHVGCQFRFALAMVLFSVLHFCFCVFCSAFSSFFLSFPIMSRPVSGGLRAGARQGRMVARGILVLILCFR